MIIHFEENIYGRVTSFDWARGEMEEERGEEEPDGDQVVGDQTYYGSAGQRFRLNLMNKLFDSPHTSAVHTLSNKTVAMFGCFGVYVM